MRNWAFLALREITDQLCLPMHRPGKTGMRNTEPKRWPSSNSWIGGGSAAISSTIPETYSRVLIGGVNSTGVAFEAVERHLGILADLDEIAVGITRVAAPFPAVIV